MRSCFSLSLSLFLCITYKQNNAEKCPWRNGAPIPYELSKQKVSSPIVFPPVFGLCVCEEHCCVLPSDRVPLTGLCSSVLSAPWAVMWGSVSPGQTVRVRCLQTYFLHVYWSFLFTPFHQMGVVLKRFYSQIKIKAFQTYLTSVKPPSSRVPRVLAFHMK